MGLRILLMWLLLLLLLVVVFCNVLYNLCYIIATKIEQINKKKMCSHGGLNFRAHRRSRVFFFKGTAYQVLVFDFIAGVCQLNLL